MELSTADRGLTMHSVSFTTEELLIDAKAGDTAAINQLMDRHRDSLYRLVQMRLDKKIQRRVGVSDIVQDSLMEASRRLSKYLDAPMMPFALWLRQIAKDRIIDAYRRHRGSAKRSVDREQNMVVSRGHDDSETDYLALCAGSDESPDEKAMRDEWAVELQESIALLPDVDSEILTLRHFKSLTNQEISRLLEVSEPAASMRYLRAIKRLREIVQGRTNESN